MCMPTYFKVIFHVLEVLAMALVVILIGWLSHTYLHIDISGDLKVILVAVLAGIPKLARESDSIPVDDYGNGKTK